MQRKCKRSADGWGYGVVPLNTEADGNTTVGQAPVVHDHHQAKPFGGRRIHGKDG